MLALGVALLTSLALASPGGATHVAQPVLTQLILRPSQIGSGYRLVERADGHGIHLHGGTLVTLDMCGFSFPSEALRLGRLQVDYVRSASAIGLSNEVVSYIPGGAQVAIAEVRSAFEHCPKKPVVSAAFGGPPTRTRLTLIADKRLLPGYIAFRQVDTWTEKGKKQTSTTISIFQAHGNVLSGVYAYLGTKTSILETETFALHAAEASAKNLTHNA